MTGFTFSRSVIITDGITGTERIHKMKLRDPLEEEITIIKKRTIPEEIWCIAVCVFFDLLVLSCIPLGISTIIRKGSIPFAIFSIFIQLLLLALAVFVFTLLIGCVKKISLISKGQFQVEECTIEKIDVSVGYKKRVVWATVKTQEGKNRKIRARYRLKKKDKGRRAVIMRFDPKKKIDDELVVIGTDDE